MDPPKSAKNVGKLNSENPIRVVVTSLLKLITIDEWFLFHDVDVVNVPLVMVDLKKRNKELKKISNFLCTCRVSCIRKRGNHKTNPTMFPQNDLHSEAGSVGWPGCSLTWPRMGWLQHVQWRLSWTLCRILHSFYIARSGNWHSQSTSETCFMYVIISYKQ